MVGVCARAHAGERMVSVPCLPDSVAKVDVRRDVSSGFYFHEGSRSDVSVREDLRSSEVWMGVIRE